MPGFVPIGSLPIADAPELDVIGSAAWSFQGETEATSTAPWVIGAAAWSFQGETEAIGTTPFAVELEAGKIALAFATDIDLRSL